MRLSHSVHIAGSLSDVFVTLSSARALALHRVVFHVDGTAPARASRVRGEIIATISEVGDDVQVGLASDIGTAGALAQFSDAVFAGALHDSFDTISHRLSSQSTSTRADIASDEPRQTSDSEVRPRGWRRRN